MIHIYAGPTPNGFKPLLFAAEHGIDIEYHPISLANGEQFAPEFLKITPNNKIPAMVDGDVKIFESGVILEYLADKFLGFRDDPKRYDILAWVYWQTSGLGPMGGQHRFFREGAAVVMPEAIKRFADECARLYRVLDGHLADHEFIGGGGYHIADMMIYPWVKYYADNELVEGDYPNINRWFWALADRPSVKKVYGVG